MPALLGLARTMLMAFGLGKAAEVAAPLWPGGAPAGEAVSEMPFFGGFFGKAAAKRRRRRKALSSDDLRLALTIASAISKKAAENFILQRVRRG